MAAKLLYSLADDNQDLQKQIGCMTGMLQLFDRPNALTGRHISHKRLPPGHNGFYFPTLSFLSYKSKNQEIYLVVLLLIYGFSLQILHISDVEVRETSSHSFYVFIIFTLSVWNKFRFWSEYFI